MSRVDRFLDSLLTHAVADPKRRFTRLAAFARELERELAALGPSNSTLPRWIHCSERLPGRAGKYAVVVYDPKSDGKMLGASAFGENGKFTVNFPDFHVAYWLENLELPGEETLQRIMSSLTRSQPDPRNGTKGTRAPAGSRVDRFIASLPEYRATAPRTRVRFLESFAMQLERELETAASPDGDPPRWVSCADRDPRRAGTYLVIVDRPRESVALAAAGFRGRSFVSTAEETCVHFWLEGLEMPPFHHQASHAFGAKSPTKKE
jgi:hypothetical protein